MKIQSAGEVLLLIVGFFLKLNIFEDDFDTRKFFEMSLRHYLMGIFVEKRRILEIEREGLGVKVYEVLLLIVGFFEIFFFVR